MSRKKKEEGMKFQFRLSEEEYNKLVKQSNEVGLSKSDFLRKQINGYNPTPKISEEFFNSIGEIRKLTYLLERLHNKLEELGYVDEYELKEISKSCKEFIIGLYREYIDPKLKKEDENEKTRI